MLKIIAIIAMVIDHCGSALFSGTEYYTVMRMIGRIAFPIFAYCIAVGANYTSSMPKYLGRILLLAVISQPFYVLALNHAPNIALFDFANQSVQAAILWYVESLRYCNIMVELALGLLVIWSIKERRYALSACAAALVLLMEPYLSTSYGVRGVMMMVLFYALLDRPLAAIAWVAGLMIWWSPPAIQLPFGGKEFIFRANIQFYALLALPFIALPMKSRWRLNKWIFYLFYPVHLGVIYLIDYLR